MFYTTDEMAARYKVNVRTIQRWAESGLLPAPVKIGGATRWRADDVAAAEAKLQPAPRKE